MFKSFRIASVFGIPLTLHWSLLVLSAYLVASGWNDGGPQAAFDAGLLVVLVFASVLAHEMGHIAAARRYGIGAEAINLSVLGGIAFLERMPDRPGRQIFIALGGPAVTLLLTAVFTAWAVASVGSKEEALGSPIVHVALINFMLFAFNMLPIYPMDGGLVFKAVNEMLFGRRVASGIARLTGIAAGVAMIAYGTWTLDWSLMLIGAFIALVSVAEIVAARTRRKAASVSGPAEDAVVLPGRSLGIYVAFDGDGRHFAYAKHWVGPDGVDLGQMEDIQRYREEAESRGGRLTLLSPEEFDRLVVRAA